MRKHLFLLTIISSFLPLMMRGEVQVLSAGGLLESAYIEWIPEQGVEYSVMVTNPSEGTMQTLDNQLIRSYGSYFRADAVGLKPGEYVLSIFPKVKEEPGMESGVPPLATTEPLTVKAYDRNGFAHFDYPQGVGAYKNDGTLKDGAKVLYVHAGNAKTVEMDVVIDNKGKITYNQDFLNILFEIY